MEESRREEVRKGEERERRKETTQLASPFKQPSVHVSRDVCVSVPAAACALVSSVAPTSDVLDSGRSSSSNPVRLLG